uniref:Uncharacterized protein n=1 Tax=viral metagenome TaxID=1070528 RepID=A0A6C0H4W1_9ZZZZ
MPPPQTQRGFLQNIINKFYFHITVAVVLLLIGLFFYLNDILNIFKIKDTQYSIFWWLLLLTFGIYTILFYFSINKDSTSNASLKIDYVFFNMFKHLSLICLIILVPVFIINFILDNLKITNNSGFNFVLSIIGILIIIVLFAVIAKVFSIQPSNTDNCINTGTINFQYIICVLKNIIFFIPCLLVILVDEIHEDIKLTPSSIYLLFIVLVILITLLISLPLLFTFFAKNNKNDVLAGEGPFYLNKKKTLGKYQNLDKNISDNIAIPKFNSSNDDTNLNIENNQLARKMTTLFSYFNTSPSTNISSENSSNVDTVKNEYNNTKNNVNYNIDGYNFKLFKNDLVGLYNIGVNYFNPSKLHKTFPYNYTYSLSFYIYINPQPTNTSIAYTKDTELFNYGFKPVIYYNGNSRKIIIKSRTISNKSDQLDTIYEMSNVKHQKWLYFVINYENNIIDVFIDGKLVGSKSNVTPYFVGDNVTIGEDNGIYGSIKDIYYFDKIKTPDSIQFLYNLTKNKISI